MGYDFYGMDMRGHGKSEGRVAYFENVTMLVDDLNGYIFKVLQLYDKDKGFNKVPPVFIVAHGLGALIVLKYLLNSNEYFCTT